MKALQKFVEVPLYWERISKVPEDRLALLAVASYAATEFNVLLKTYISCMHDYPEDDAMLAAVAAQRHVILRAWSAKLFEFFGCIEGVASGKTKTEKVVQDLAAGSIEDFRDLEQAEGYKIARAIRHEAANHYSMTAARKNLKFISQNANCKLYIHKMDGNSFYPFGEEVMFIGRLNRHGQHLDEQAIIAQQNTWHSWNIAASRWAKDVHTRIVRKFILEEFSDISAREKVYWLNPELVGDRSTKTPIFLRDMGMSQ